MKIFISLLASALLLLSAFASQAKKKDALFACRDKQAGALNGKVLTFSYQEKLNELYHSPEPWQLMNYEGRGEVWLSAESFRKADTLVIGKRKYHSQMHLEKDHLLVLDYGDKDMLPITRTVFNDYLMKSARYSPVPLISYFIREEVPADKTPQLEFAVYKKQIGKAVVTLYIDRASFLADKITVLEDDPLRGDVLTVYKYSDFAVVAKATYPRLIQVEKMNGRIKDTVSIEIAALASDPPVLLEKPAGYVIKQDESKKDSVAKITRYSDHIHFIDLMPAGARTLVVEFDDFLLVEGAPQNSTNGELIIAEVRKITPGKPIKYFLFGHHHPDYLGGMRAFIHKGATVLAVPENKDYLSFLATAPHTLGPDSLQMQPRPLKMEEVKDSVIITDGKYRMNIYHIGNKSGHTSDYLVYYFPDEKMLFEDDLVWINEEGGPQKAGPRLSGLYDALKELHLDIDTIVQSWGIAMDGYKTIIPFADVEASMNVKE
jgi:glyoxylase-like metal-dependent hydrolase (beta-lactamase superfamily II)